MPWSTPPPFHNPYFCQPYPPNFQPQFYPMGFQQPQPMSGQETIANARKLMKLQRKYEKEYREILKEEEEEQKKNNKPEQKTWWTKRSVAERVLILNALAPFLIIIYLGTMLTAFSSLVSMFKPFLQ